MSLKSNAIYQKTTPAFAAGCPDFNKVIAAYLAKLGNTNETAEQVYNKIVSASKGGDKNKISYDTIVGVNPAYAPDAYGFEKKDYYTQDEVKKIAEAIVKGVQAKKTSSNPTVEGKYDDEADWKEACFAPSSTVSPPKTKSQPRPQVKGDEQTKGCLDPDIEVIENKPSKKN